MRVQRQRRTEEKMNFRFKCARRQRIRRWHTQFYIGRYEVRGTCVVCVFPYSACISFRGFFLFNYKTQHTLDHVRRIATYSRSTFLLFFFFFFCYYYYYFRFFYFRWCSTTETTANTIHILCVRRAPMAQRFDHTHDLYTDTTRAHTVANECEGAQKHQHAMTQLPFALKKINCFQL